MSIRRNTLHLLLLLLMFPVLAFCQGGRGSVSGTVTDTAGAALPGALVTLTPVGSAKTDSQGQFTIGNLPEGNYSLTVSYVGFSPFVVNFTITAGQMQKVNPVMGVAAGKEDVIVYADRRFGEAAAINQERTSENILNVLPSEVIKSLPNANIADAVGRLPGVTLERDEGEGKYVQIRGTEPRLSNVTIDGINVPSPEGNVRQIKLDVIPSDLVESVEINKTLSANQDGDAIGGSVNLVTKRAGDDPTLVVYGTGGYTPIVNGVHISEYGGTFGRRLGPDKRLGFLLGGTYDYNGRGIDDVEPSPTPGSASPHYDSIDLREYKYDRTRFGFAGSTDYKLKEGSDLYLRGFYSEFKDFGDRWVYSLNDQDVPSYNTSRRTPDYAIAVLNTGGRHLFTNSWLSYGLSAARSRQADAAGNPGARFKVVKGSVLDNTAANICYNDPSNTKSQYRPQWSAACTAAGSPVYDPTQYSLKELDFSHGQTTQLNLQAEESYALNYHAGPHIGTFEFGAKVRNAHKGQYAFSPAYIPGNTVTMGNFVGSFRNTNYYDGSYKFGPTADWDKIVGYYNANQSSFSTDEASTHLNSDASNYNLNERITAGYLMNTLEFSRLRLQTGLRFEATHLSTTGYHVTNDSDGNYVSTTPVNETGSYLDALPMIQARIALNKNAAIRAVYGRGLARPNPQDVIPYVSEDQSTNPYTYSLGNPNLKAEHANNYDLLYEQYLNPLGLIQAGFFYKDISDPIVTLTSTPATGAYAGFKVTQPANAGSAYVTGIEIAFQQHLSYLPGLLSGLGFSGNYSYTASKAHHVMQGRSDSPALLRQAPNTWNISPTYDRGIFSLRLGIAYNGPNIYAYQWTDGADNVGIKGPSGDNYLYAHTQIDAQGTLRLTHGFTLVVSGLNLNNEVFGFYNGSPQYVVQREYYKPTYSAGLRWSPSREH